MTQSQVADRLGVRVATVADHERGVAMPSGLTLQQYASIYDCSADEIDLSPRQQAVA